MIYKEYGKTGKLVSALGFGGLKFTKADIENNNMQDSIAAVRYAYEKGVNFYDTAPTYAMGYSEAIIGKALEGFDRETYFLSTKNAIHHTNDKTSSDFRRRLENSLINLKSEKIDFYHLWYMKDWECFCRHVKGKDSMLSFLQKAKEEKLIEHICFSTHASPDEIKNMVDYFDFAGLILSYNIVNHHYYDDLIEYIGNKGIGITVMNPLVGGAIPQNKEFFDFIKTDGISQIQSALRYVISNKNVTCGLSGMTSKLEVDENTEAAGKLFDAETIADLNKKINKINLKLCTVCGYCKGCPVDIPVYKYMESYNINVLFDGYSVKRRLRDFWGINDVYELEKCIKCGKCEDVCTQQLPILSRFEEFPDLR